MLAWRAMVALTVLAAAACGDEDAADGDEASACTAETASTGTDVDMIGLSFQPSCLRVPVGTTVTFRNTDGTPHTVTTDSGQAMTFDSGVIADGGVHMQLFDVAGTIGIHCELHPSMTASVFVTE